jgi:hypothetical protein
MAVVAFHRYRYSTVPFLALYLDASKKLLKALEPVIDLELFEHLTAR